MFICYLSVGIKVYDEKVQLYSRNFEVENVHKMQNNLKNLVFSLKNWRKLFVTVKK